MRDTKEVFFSFRRVGARCVDWMGGGAKGVGGSDVLLGLNVKGDVGIVSICYEGRR